MRLKEILIRLRNDPKEAVHYVVGSTVLFMEGRKWLRWLLPFHVRFWLEYRKIRAKDCLYNGECFCCGCDTPGVFGATKGCKAYKYRENPLCGSRKTCYPPMYNKERTLLFLKRIIKNGTV